MDDAKLWDLARHKLRRGALPRNAQIRTWGGPGVGLPCSLCDQTIVVDDNELELQFENESAVRQLSAARFHSRCFAIWELSRQEA